MLFFTFFAELLLLCLLNPLFSGFCVLSSATCVCGGLVRCSLLPLDLSLAAVFADEILPLFSALLCASPYRLCSLLCLSYFSKKWERLPLLPLFFKNSKTFFFSAFFFCFLLILHRKRGGGGGGRLIHE